MTTSDAQACHSVEPPDVDDGGDDEWIPRWAKVVVGVVVAGMVLLVWGVLAATSGLSAARDLEAARDRLIAAEGLLRDGELSNAREELAVAMDASTQASATLRRIHVVPLRILPVIGPNLRAATILSDTARDVGTATADLLDVAAVIVSDDRSQDPGEISLTYLSELGPPLRELVTQLQASTEAVAAIDADPLIGRVASARQRFLDVVEPNLNQVVLAADVIDVMPSFLGEGEPRRYLVGAAALSEIRGSAGLLGSWSIMTAHEGRMDFEEFIDVDELPQATAPVSAPSDEFEQRYGRYGALEMWRNANISPDFPAVADVLMEMYTAGGGAPVDGVIVADTIVIERLSERSDGLRIPGIGDLRPEETLRFVGLDAYADFEDDDERKRVLGATATSAFAEMFQILEDDDVPATIEMLADITQGGHLLIHVRDDEVQPVLERAGVAGELPPVDGESFGVFVNNFAQHKLDFFLEREMDHHVRLRPDGVTESEVQITFHNDAPTEGFPRAVIGPWMDGLEAGDNRSLVTATCSRSCEITGMPDGALSGGTERGRPMVDDVLQQSPGDRTTLQFRTVSQDAWQIIDDLVVVDVDHLVQPAIREARLQVRVEVPHGYEAVDLPEGARSEDGMVIWAGTASGRVQLSFSFVSQES